MLKIRNAKTGETTGMTRGVDNIHPEWVHAQIETASEAELQGFLDNCSLAEFAENAGREDSAGVFMEAQDADELFGIVRIEFAERGCGFPGHGQIIIDHGNETAWRVLPDAAPGDGTIKAHGHGRSNVAILRVAEVDYDDYCDDEDAWES